MDRLQRSIVLVLALLLIIMLTPLHTIAQNVDYVGSTMWSGITDAKAVGDYAYMMRGGVFTFEGKANDLLNHPQLEEMYLGAVEVKDLRTIRE